MQLTIGVAHQGAERLSRGIDCRYGGLDRLSGLLIRRVNYGLDWILVRQRGSLVWVLGLVGRDVDYQSSLYTTWSCFSSCGCRLTSVDSGDTTCADSGSGCTCSRLFVDPSSLPSFLLFGLVLRGAVVAGEGGCDCAMVVGATEAGSGEGVLFMLSRVRTRTVSASKAP